MWNFRRKHLLPAVLDVSSDGIRMVQLSCTAGAVRIVSAARRMFAGDANPTHGAVGEDLADELRRMLIDAPPGNRRVIAALPPGIVHLRTLRLPPNAPENLEAELRTAARESFPFDLAEATLRFFVAGTIREEGKQRTEVIAAAVRRQDIAAFLAALHRAGLRAQSLRLAPSAMYDCALRAMPPINDAPVAMIDVGDGCSHVVIGRDKQVSFIKRIDIGGGHLNQAVAKKLGLTRDEVVDLRRRLTGSRQGVDSPRDGIAGALFDATRGLLEELAHEAAACFRYHAITFRGPRPARIALLGNESADPHLRRTLAAEIPGDLQVIDPFSGIDPSAMRSIYRDGPAGEWTTCIGLAAASLREATRRPAVEQICDATRPPAVQQMREPDVIATAPTNDISQEGPAAAA